LPEVRNQSTKRSKGERQSLVCTQRSVRVPQPNTMLGQACVFVRKKPITKRTCASNFSTPLCPLPCPTSCSTARFPVSATFWPIKTATCAKRCGHKPGNRSSVQNSALKNHEDGGPGGAAELPGIHPSTLRARMRKLGIVFGRKAAHSLSQN